MLYVTVLILITLIAWILCNVLPLSDFNTILNLGYTGIGVMLLGLLYPIRKHLKTFRRWGKMKWWMYLHIITGILGPLIILVHTRFHFGSTNSLVAFCSMCAVVISGMVGRFLQLKVEHGSNLKKLYDAWHVIHVPFVYMMLLTVAFHIYSVYSY